MRYAVYMERRPFGWRCTGVALLLAVLGACALVEPVAGPVTVPPVAAETVVGAGATPLPLRTWMPVDEPKAIVLALHGFTDHSGSFANPAVTWVQHGIAVYAYDQRGFGATDSAGTWAGTEALVADLQAVGAAIHARHPGVPLFLVGESMGAAVMLAALSRGGLPDNHGSVLVAPAVWGWQAMHPFTARALQFFANTMPGITFGAGAPRVRASDNDAVRAAIARDPLVLHSIRLDMIEGLITLMDDALDNAGLVPPDAIVLYGANDHTVPKRAKEALLARVPPAQVRTFAKGHHLLFRDLDADEVIDATLDWIEARLGAEPEATPPMDATSRAAAR